MIQELYRVCAHRCRYNLEGDLLAVLKMLAGLECFFERVFILHEVESFRTEPKQASALSNELKSIQHVTYLIPIHLQCQESLLII